MGALSVAAMRPVPSADQYNHGIEPCLGTQTDRDVQRETLDFGTGVALV
jgi:hypothetical protein